MSQQLAACVRVFDEKNAIFFFIIFRRSVCCEKILIFQYVNFFLFIFQIWLYQFQNFRKHYRSKFFSGHLLAKKVIQLFCCSLVQFSLLVISVYSRWYWCKKTEGTQPLVPLKHFVCKNRCSRDHIFTWLLQVIMFLQWNPRQYFSMTHFCDVIHKCRYFPPVCSVDRLCWRDSLQSLRHQRNFDPQGD